VRCVYAESECNPVVVFSQSWLRTLVVQCNAAEADMSHSKERRGELSVIAILLGFGCRLSCHARSSSGDGIMPGILRPGGPSLARRNASTGAPAHTATSRFTH
jgi:hypothetical protein